VSTSASSDLLLKGIIRVVSANGRGSPIKSSVGDSTISDLDSSASSEQLGATICPVTSRQRLAALYHKVRSECSIYKAVRDDEGVGEHEKVEITMFVLALLSAEAFQTRLNSVVRSEIHELLSHNLRDEDIRTEVIELSKELQPMEHCCRGTELKENGVTVSVMEITDDSQV
jgi:hypothetical protein